MTTTRDGQGAPLEAEQEPLLAVSNLKKHFPINSGMLASVRYDPGSGGFPFAWDDSSVKAVDGVDFELKPGETFGVVGESGCGKSTLARTIIGLEEPTDGEITFDGLPRDDIPEGEFRKRTQMVFQDPQSSLNSRRKVGHIIEDPLEGTGWPESDPAVSTVADVEQIGLAAFDVRVSVPDDADLVVDVEDDVATVPVTVRARDGQENDQEPAVTADVPWGLDAEVTVDETRDVIDVEVSVTATTTELRRNRALELLEQVGLKREYYNRYPHEFSGGQRQRINLARALSINPDLVIADEPVSGLDVSVQAQILNLMDDLQEEYGLTYLLISHDLSVVRYIADRVAVMYLGEFVEVAPAEELFIEQHHPYARALLSAVPNPDPDMPGARSEIRGSVPSASDPPRGCRFHTRCPDFILPDGFSMDAYEAYDRLLADVRSRSLADGLEDETAPLEAYFEETGPPPAARQAAEDAIDAALEGRWDEARATLEAHESVCQTRSPSLEAVDSSDRLAACHLLTEEASNPEVTTDG